MIIAKSTKIKEVLKNFQKSRPKDRIPYTAWKKLQNLSGSCEVLFSGCPKLFIDGIELVSADFYKFIWSELSYSEKTPKEAPQEVKPKESHSNLFNFKFGPAEGAGLSLYGISICDKEGRWVSYDKKNDSIVDVSPFNFESKEVIYRMPTGLDAVCVGDILIHNETPCIVSEINTGSFTVIDYFNSTEKTILPIKNIFGFNFVEKLVSLINLDSVSENSPFGNLLPLILLEV